MKKTEELIPLHEEDIHFNIIVHKSHNTYSNLSRTQEHIKFQHKENTTIFGDNIHPKAPFSWAQVTNINRPAHQETQQVPAPKVNRLQYRNKKRIIPLLGTSSLGKYLPQVTLMIMDGILWVREERPVSSTIFPYIIGLKVSLILMT